MSDINWNDGAVCCADGKQWVSLDWNFEDALCMILVKYDDFQLNEIREGDFIPASELDTGQKYNDVVEVFGLFGITASVDHRGFCAENPFCLVVCDDGYAYTEMYRKRQLTYHQIIAIGKLKRMMLERERKFKADIFCGRPFGGPIKNTNDVYLVGDGAPVKFTPNYDSNPFSKYSKENFPKLDLEEKPKRRNKSKQAYDILKSLDYEYDLVKQKWFKKQYID